MTPVASGKSARPRRSPAGRVTWILTAASFLALLLSGSWSARAGATRTADVLPRLARGIVGREFDYTVARDQSLQSIGARYGIDPRLLASENGLAPGAPIKPGRVLHIDNRHLVPADLDDGILINVPQKMLFFFCRGAVEAAYPVGLGRPTWPTPRGGFQVLELREHPVWRVPKSIQHEMAMQGKLVKTVVPPGPDNPLGDYWIGLSIPAIGIHSTSAPMSIYGFRTHGCIRLHPEDAEALFDAVAVGQPGQIVYEPVLLGKLDDGRIFLEVHRDVYRKGASDLDDLQAIAYSHDLENLINWTRGAEVVRKADGIARDVTLAPAGAPTP